MQFGVLTGDFQITDHDGSEAGDAAGPLKGKVGVQPG